MTVSFQGLFSPLPLRSIAGTSLTNPALFYAVGAPLERPARVIKWDNTTDREIFLSVNGVETFTVMPPGSYFVLDISTNTTKVTDYLCAAGTQFWATTSTTAPTTGSVFVTAIGSRDY